jgi:branched-subunit amino acid transport protein
VTELSWTIAAMAAVTYGARAWGLWLPATRPRGFARRFLDGVPVAVFAGLAASGLPGAGPLDGAWRLAAATVTVLAVARTRALAPGLLAGLVLYLAARALGWA